MIFETTTLNMTKKELEEFVQEVTQKTLASQQETYSISETSKYLNRSRKTIYNYMDRGILTPQRNLYGKIYFLKNQLDEIQRAHKV